MNDILKQLMVDLPDMVSPHYEYLDTTILIEALFDKQHKLLELPDSELTKQEQEFITWVQLNLT